MKTKVMLCMPIIVIFFILQFFACKKQTTNEELNGIYIVPLSGSSAIENKTLLYSSTPYKFPLGTAISSLVTTDIELTIAIDNSIVDSYNSSQNTKYVVMPQGSYSLETTTLTIPKDKLASNQTSLIIKADMLSPDVSYLLPVKIATVSSSNITLNAAVGTKYYIIRTPTPVIGNLSDGKKSYWKNPSTSFNAFRGNDGNSNGNWADGSVCESGSGAEQYWEVDLGAVSPRIDEVKIWNRTDCCNDRTSKFYIFISDMPFTGTTVAASLAQPGVYHYYNDGNAGTPSIVAPKVSGRYVRLQNSTSASLTLAELTVTGIKP